MTIDAPSPTPFKPFASTFARAPLASLRKSGMVDEHAITLRLQPLRWRDRVLPDVLRWTGAAAIVTTVAGGCLFFAGPSEAKRIDPRGAGAAPMMAQMTEVAPMLGKARFDPGPEMKDAGVQIEGEEEDVIIILEDEEEEEEEEDDDEILIFDNVLDAPSAAAMAVAHLERSEHGLALQYARQAAEAEPRNPAHQVLLGKTYRLTGDRSAARKALRRARRLRR